jgi:hypothetical protein
MAWSSPVQHSTPVTSCAAPTVDTPDCPSSPAGGQRHDPQGAGNDVLSGDNGNDQLYGEAGDDFLSGDGDASALDMARRRLCRIAAHRQARHLQNFPAIAAPDVVRRNTMGSLGACPLSSKNRAKLLIMPCTDDRSNTPKTRYIRT